MGPSARVESVEALREFRVSLCKFVEAARSALGEAEADLQRHTFWLSDDRQRYWRMEVRKRQEQMRQAKMALLEKKLQKTSGGTRLSCVDEEKALALAERRFEQAQTKAANTKLWIRRLDEQIFQYKGLLQALNHALDVDVAKGLAGLDAMLQALEAYVALAPPPAAPPVGESVTAARTGPAAAPPREPEAGQAGETEPSSPPDEQEPSR